MHRSPLIDRHHSLLLRLLRVLSFMIGGTLSRERYFRAMRMMRPAESALRRLIALAALELHLSPRETAPFPAGLALGAGGKATGRFALFDARLNPKPPVRRAVGLRISLADEPPEPAPQRAIDRAALQERLARFERAARNLNAEAKRLARWRQKAARKGRYIRPPMRPGRPPGLRSKPAHIVEHLLRDLQILALARYADTS